MASHIPSSYHPDQPLDIPLAEHTWFQGTFLAAVAYGIEVKLFSMTCYFLWKQRCPTNQRRLFFMLYNSIIFALSTLYTAALLQHAQLAFIDRAQGAPSYHPFLFTPFERVISFAMVIQGLVCDMINLWRSIVVYQGCRIPSWLVNTILALLYLASLGLGVNSLAHSYDGAALMSIPIFGFLVVSLCFNILITFLLVIRILVFRRRIIRSLGKCHGSEYVSLTAMIVESAALQSTFALLYIGTSLSTSHKTQPMVQTFLQVLPLIQGISTFLIFLRVAQGKAWKKGTYDSTIQALSTLKFADETNDGPSRQDVDIQSAEQAAV